MSKKQGNSLLDLNSFSSRIRKKIGTEHGSQARAAKRLNLSDSQLSNILTGAAPVTVDFLINFANVYNCSIDELLGIEKEKSNLIAAPSPRLIMSVIDYLNKSGYIHLENCVTTDRVQGVNGYPDYVDVDVVSIVPDASTIRNMLKMYNHLYKYPEQDFRDEMVRSWLNIQSNVPFDVLDIPGKLCE